MARSLMTPDDDQGTPIPAWKLQPFQSARSFVQGAMRGFFPVMDPIPPVAPPDTRPWAFDRDVGANISIEPRASEEITFQQMRNMAKYCDILRICIEKSKDEIVKIPWQFRLKPQPGQRRADLKKQTAKDNRIAELTAFFEYPDREHDWASWLRAILEDYFVVDAVAINRWLKRNGGLYALEVIDGTTIKRIMTNEARTPVPPDPAYQQILKGMPAINLTTDQLFYFPANVRSFAFYGFSKVEQIVMTINIALNKTYSQLAYFTEGNIPEAVLLCPKDWSADQISRVQTQVNAMLQGNLDAKQRLTLLPGGDGASFHETKDKVITDAGDEFIIRMVCSVFAVSPNPFIRQMTRANAEDAKEQAEAVGQKPTMDFVVSRLNFMVRKCWGYTDIDFAFMSEKEENAVEAADIADKKLRNGTWAIDDARDQEGLDPLPNGAGSRPMVYLPTGPIPVEEIDDHNAAALEAAQRGAQQPANPDDPNTPNNRGNRNQPKPAKKFKYAVTA